MHQRQDSQHEGSVGRHIRILHSRSQSWRRVQVECEGNILGQRLRCIRLLVLLIVLAHGLSRALGIRRTLADASYFRAHSRSQRVRGVQILVVSTGVDGGKHCEQSLVGVQGHRALILRRRQLRQQGKQGRVKRASEPTTQGNLLQAGRYAGYDLLSKCKGCSPENQWTLLQLLIQNCFFAAEPPGTRRRYPFTLTFENDSIARPVVGLPMESAGRNVVKVVKISMFFLTCGSSALSSLESERMR